MNKSDSASARQHMHAFKKGEMGERG